MVRQERTLGKQPKWTLVLLGSCILLQAWVYQSAPAKHPEPSPLPQPPSASTLEVLSLNEPGLLSRLLSLWLMHFDQQSGLSVSFHEVSYPRLKAWLTRIAELDSDNRFPSLAAINVYAGVRDTDKVQEMVDFVREQYANSPYSHWRRMAESVIIAKYRLKDLPLALQLATALAKTPAKGIIPSWAQQMAIFVYEDMGELQSSVILLETLLKKGEVRDSNERKFLEERLSEIKDRIVERSTDSR